MAGIHFPERLFREIGTSLGAVLQKLALPGATQGRSWHKWDGTPAYSNAGYFTQNPAHTSIGDGP